MFLIEVALTLVAALIAVLRPWLVNRKLEVPERSLALLSQRPCLAVVLVGFIGVFSRVAVLPWLPIPSPGIADEFGHLLAADTFAHFRVTNPTNPMWLHFENLSAIQRPTYASKYPPGQGLFLAFGEVVFGHPFWGVCLSIGLMCAAICWALQGWVSPKWAIIGGLLAVVRLGTFSYWANSYWGGAVAAIGGALVFGALPRIKAEQKVWHASVMALGLGVLANSRPYEGLLLSLPVLVYVLFFLLKVRPEKRVRVVCRVALPMVAVLTLAFAAMAYYCWRITGSPIRTPYQVAQNTYYPTPLFVFQPLPRLQNYQNAVFADDFAHWEFPAYHASREHPLLVAEIKIIHFWLFFFGPTLSLPCAALLFALPYGYSWKNLSTETRQLLTITVISLVGMLLPLFFNPGYIAPLTVVIYILLIKAMCRLRLWKVNGQLVGAALVHASLALCVLLIVVRVLAAPLHLSLYGARTWCSRDFQLTDRANLLFTLSRLDKDQLVIVHHPKIRLSAGEWIFNDADIDKAKVIWARDMGPQKNAELISYFKDRQVWLLEPDAGPANISRYPN